MKKYFFPILVSIAFLLSAIPVMAQTADKPVLQRSSMSSQTKREMPNAELKKNSSGMTNKKNSADSLLLSYPPQLKRTENSPIRKENIKSTK